MESWGVTLGTWRSDNGNPTALAILPIRAIMEVVKKLPRWCYFWVALLAVLALAGCGGSSSGSVTPPMDWSGYTAYTSTAARVTVKFPTDWSVSTDTSASLFTATSTTHGAISMILMPPQTIPIPLQVGDLASQMEVASQSSAGYVSHGHTTLTLNGLPAARYLYAFTSTDPVTQAPTTIDVCDYYLLHGSTYYLVKALTRSGVLANYQTILDTILSSFTINAS